MNNNNIYNCLIALNGDVRHVISKDGLTVPEIGILRNMHGSSALTEISLTGKEKYDSDSERDRLGKLYTDEKVQASFGVYGDLPMEIKKLKIDSGCLKKGDPINALPKVEESKVEA